MTVGKEPADVATTEGLGAFPAVDVIDEVTLKVGDRVLVKDQLMSTENGYYIVAEIAGALTLTTTDETLEVEDVIRVSQGNRNAHTAWALIDAVNRMFVRQDVKHYSLKSIDELKHLWQVLPGATATVAGYYAPGDRGGGDFTFLGVQESARVISVEPVDIAISDVTNVNGLVKITAIGHGLGVPNIVTSTYVEGLNGLSDGAYYVDIGVMEEKIDPITNKVTPVQDPNTLTLHGYFAGVNLGVNARIQYVKVVTAAEHGRATGMRVSLTGIQELGGAPRINGIIQDGCGVIDKTSLSIPIKHRGGTYTVGKNALIGDDALMVPASDIHTEKEVFDGNFSGLWQRLYADHIDVRWFGAKGDWVPPGQIFPPPDPTDDLPAFQAALAALKGFDNRGGKLVADGHFFLSGTLDFYQAVVFEGTGRNEPSGGPGALRSSPGTWLVFPKNVSGLRFHSGYEFMGAADGSLIQNLTVYCNYIRPNPDPNFTPPPEPGQTGHGIWLNCPVSCNQVHVENFGENGFYVDAGSDRPATHANAGGFQFTKCKSGANGKHGYYILGEDATVGLISCCEAQVNYGWGFFDDTPAGNTFIACHAEGNLGNPGGHDADKKNHDYKTSDSRQNASCFLSCYTEYAVNEIYFPASVIGGLLAEGSINKSDGFALNGGIANNNPIVYEYKNPLHPEVASRIQIGGGLDSVDLILTISRSGNEPSYLTYRSDIDWWSFYNQGFYRQIYLLPTVKSHVRSSGMWLPNGLFLGSGDSDAVQQLHLAAPAPVANQAGGEHRT